MIDTKLNSTIIFASDGSSTIERILAGGGDDLVIDYTVLAMAVVTMALLLIVAVIRHRIDHLARGKGYFEDVLEAVYHECKFVFFIYIQFMMEWI